MLSTVETVLPGLAPVLGETAPMSLFDRAEMVMTQVRARIDDIVEGGCLMPFTRSDLDDLIGQWSSGTARPDRENLSGLVTAMYARTYA